MRFALGSALAVVCLIGTAAAQPPAAPRSANGPTTSPYLNLARRGLGPAVNYYGIVRPQVQTAATLQGLQEPTNLPSPFAAASGGDQPVVTGNPYGFQNYRLYFQNQFTAGGYGPPQVGQASNRTPLAAPIAQSYTPPPRRR